MFSFLELQQPVPSWYSGRLWLLRLGYYKLHREQKRADDWIWIVDHTIQLGSEKCLVILGVRQSNLPEAELYLDHEDVEPIALLPVTHSNGEVVFQQLTQTVEKTGLPREIISDHGSDIKSGIEKFCQDHEQTCFIYDIKHKGAAILKRELKDDPHWSTFIQLAAQTRKKVQQTCLSALAPPNQRSKARYMNVDKLVKWGQEKLCYLDLLKSEPDDRFPPQQVDDKLGWLDEYRGYLAEWQDLIEVVKTTEDYIKSVGIYHDSHIELKENPIYNPHTDRAKRVDEELLTFIEQQSMKAKPDERLLGSSEVIESVFGKLKNLEQDQVKSGFTAMLLSLAAVVSKTSQNVILKALEKVPTKKVFEWYKENIVQSVQSKRKEVLSIVREAEQKWDQNTTAFLT
jgi:hypothetical protein